MSEASFHPLPFEEQSSIARFPTGPASPLALCGYAGQNFGQACVPVAVSFLTYNTGHAALRAIFTREQLIVLLRVEIKHIEPLIWRRVVVRTLMNLMALHKVMQANMGWLDYHLWEFVVDDRKYGIPDPDRPHVKNGATTKLAPILASGVTEFDYVYDFGGYWEHRIVVEQIDKAEASAKYPRFLGGERRCPPEDCGGPPGYFDFIENIARKNSKKAKEALDWYGATSSLVSRDPLSPPNPLFMGCRTLDCNQSGMVVHSRPKIMVGSPRAWND
jgi:hypothetical protein